jgi:hypothetical protein
LVVSYLYIWSILNGSKESALFLHFIPMLLNASGLFLYNSCQSMV